MDFLRKNDPSCLKKYPKGLSTKIVKSQPFSPRQNPNNNKKQQPPWNFQEESFKPLTYS